MTGPHTFDWAAFRAYLTTFLVAVIVVALTVAAILGLPAVNQRASSLVGHAPTTITIAWPPLKGATPDAPSTWLAQQFQQELLAQAYLALGDQPDTLSGDPLQRIGAAMFASGWFIKPPTVVRGSANRIHIMGQWRIPGAVVRRLGPAVIPGVPSTHEGDTAAPKEHDYLISWDSRPMPVVYPVGESGLPILSGAQDGPPTKPDGSLDFAALWPGEDVKAGLELLTLILQQPWGNQVAGVDVSNFPASRSLIINTTHRTRILWGGPVSQPRWGEGATEHKLGRIAELQRNFNRIDGGHTDVEVWWPIDRPIIIGPPPETNPDDPNALPNNLPNTTTPPGTAPSNPASTPSPTPNAAAPHTPPSVTTPPAASPPANPSTNPRRTTPPPRTTPARLRIPESAPKIDAAPRSDLRVAAR